MTKYATYGHSIDLGDIGGSIADAASAVSKVHEIDRDLEIDSVTFEGDTAMTHGGTGIVFELVRVRSTTELVIYSYTTTASTVAWTKVTLAAVSAAYSKAKAGDRFFARITNGTGAPVNPAQWHTRVGFHPGIEAATTELTYT